MSNATSIEWTDATWNPVIGCSRVSEGCRHCYAEVMAARLREMGRPEYADLTTGTGQRSRWTGTVRLVPERLAAPLTWRKPRRIFVNSMSDLFHPSMPNEDIAAVFGVMAACPQHTFQALTKRPERAVEWFGWARERGDSALPGVMAASVSTRWPLPNVWLGVSAEDQRTADERIPLLLQCPAAVRWVSAEPLLGPVDLTAWLDKPRLRTWAPWLSWVVAGGESGPGARPMHLEWVRGLRDQCREADVPFLFKQWGEWVHTEVSWHDAPVRVGKKAAGRLLDGVLHDEYPEVTP